MDDEQSSAIPAIVLVGFVVDNTDGFVASEDESDWSGKLGDDDEHRGVRSL
jgi:hypothetical protein